MDYCWSSWPLDYFGHDLSWTLEASVEFERYSHPVSWLMRKFSTPHSVLPVSHSAPMSYPAMDSPRDSTLRPHPLFPPSSTSPLGNSQSASAPPAALCSASPPSPHISLPVRPSPLQLWVPPWVYRPPSPAPNWSQWVCWPGVSLSAAPSATHLSTPWWPPKVTASLGPPPSWLLVSGDLIAHEGLHRGSAKAWCDTSRVIRAFPQGEFAALIVI
jgi:hypothetical protein